MLITGTPKSVQKAVLRNLHGKENHFTETLGFIGAMSNSMEKVIGYYDLKDVWGGHPGINASKYEAIVVVDADFLPSYPFGNLR